MLELNRHPCRRVRVNARHYDSKMRRESAYHHSPSSLKFSLPVRHIWEPRKRGLVQRDARSAGCAVPRQVNAVFAHPIAHSAKFVPNSFAILLASFSKLPPRRGLETRSRGATRRETRGREGRVRRETAGREATGEAWRGGCAPVRILLKVHGTWKP